MLSDIAPLKQTVAQKQADLHMNNMIRVLLLDQMQPYMNKYPFHINCSKYSMGKIKKSVEGVKNGMFMTQRDVEELKHQTARFKKYDDFFISCNAKILHNEHDIKMVEKKLQEEINSLWNNKFVLSEQVAKFETDNNTFVSVSPPYDY